MTKQAATLSGEAARGSVATATPHWGILSKPARNIIYSSIHNQPTRKYLRSHLGVFVTDKSAYVKQLKQRHTSAAWWARTMHEHPLGIVPIPTAARMLHITPQRVRALIEEGRFRVVDDMPGGNERDRFIPFIDLLDAPFAMSRGRPGVFGPKNRPQKKYQESIIDYANTLTGKDLK